MTDELVVVLEGEEIGRIDRDSSGRLTLTYAQDHRDSLDRTPLSVSLPRSSERHGDRSITPWLWGLLPDNDDVLERWGRRFGVSANSPFRLLGTPIGGDCAGAVQFTSPGAFDSIVDRPGSAEELDERSVAMRLRSLTADSTAWLGSGDAGRFSLGGAQAKIALHRDDGIWFEAVGSLPTTHILKPAIPGFAGQEINEHLCLAAATRLGLSAARTVVDRFEDQSAIVVERFDRTWVDATLRRIHQEDLCQALGVHPASKYQSDGGPGPEQIGELL
ncbi:MAG: HipA domain-containing protein, partial [Actinomycetota bacterium]